MVKEHYKNKLIEIITKYLPDCAIYLYGSRARKDHVAGSDIDLALDNKTTINRLVIAQIQEDIDEKTTIPLMVDLIDVHAVDKAFLETIKKEWVPWKK